MSNDDVSKNDVSKDQEYSLKRGLLLALALPIGFGLGGIAVKATGGFGADAMANAEPAALLLDDSGSASNGVADEARRVASETAERVARNVSSEVARKVARDVAKKVARETAQQAIQNAQ